MGDLQEVLGHLPRHLLGQLLQVQKLVQPVTTYLLPPVFIVCDQARDKLPWPALTSWWCVTEPFGRGPGWAPNESVKCRGGYIYHITLQFYCISFCVFSRSSNTATSVSMAHNGYQCDGYPVVPDRHSPNTHVVVTKPRVMGGIHMIAMMNASYRISRRFDCKVFRSLGCISAGSTVMGGMHAGTHRRDARLWAVSAGRRWL